MVATAFLLGLMGSLHCMGMCGPIAFMLPVDHKKPLKKAGQIGLYHFGRLLAYALIGLVFGFLGKGLYIFGMQQKLSIFIGALMILIVILPQHWFSGIKITQPLFKLIGKLKSRLGKELAKKSPDTFLSIGFLNGFLPCGLVYMALFGALAMGNPAEGSLYMILFGLGTIPLMTSVIYFSHLFKNSFKAKVRKLIPVFVMLIGALFILRGLGLGIPYVSPKMATQEVTAEVECHTP